ncbi:MAG TPA: LysR family transcriptional regulator [Noviherbaspirillum sp.]|nr:LysR family transcriptional regulator [Noviherbaspirillum sp.]
MASNIAWELYRSFLSVLTEGSLSGAARTLGVAQPTVGRHIETLEKSLGLVLFTRSQAGLMPTEAALALKPHAEAMESTAAALERAAASQGEGVHGVVRVTASDVVGVEVLPPVVAALRRQYPDLKVELVLTNRVQDLLHREADIAVRMTKPTQKQLIARHVGKIEVGMFASTEYVKRYGKPDSLDALQAHSLIGFDRPNAFVRSAAKSLQGLDREMFSVRADNDLAQLALIRAGTGIGICQVALAKRSGLVRLLSKQFQLHLETWITMHEDLRHSPRCRVTFDALAEGLQRHARGLALS